MSSCLVGFDFQQLLVFPILPHSLPWYIVCTLPVFLPTAFYATHTSNIMHAPLLFPWLQALPSLQHGLELHEAHFDPDGPEVATAMCELATLYTHTGKVKLVSDTIYLQSDL